MGIFTDSRYSLDSIAEHTQTSKHHKLVEQIQDTIHRMGSNVILHWIPSHIELRTRTRKLKIHGNDIADQLANQAAKSSDQPMDYNREYIALPRSLNEIAKNITYSIGKKIQKIW